MHGFPTSTKHEKKCNVTHGTMGHLDPKQPPVKRKPFGAILNTHFIQKTELILPGELYEMMGRDFLSKCETPVYSRVILPLQALLEGEFFNQYIKRGKVLMLSEGGMGAKNIYSLREGILTMWLDKESYERAGIVGKPDGVKGGRGTKPRWIVEIELRLPSMLHGKKRFDKINYACKNVLNAPVTWLFCDLGTAALSPDPLEGHFPIKVTISPEIDMNINVNQPCFRPPCTSTPEYEGDFEDFAVETLEWLSLVSLGSPRIDPNDRVDPVLSRYVPPGDLTLSSKLVKITWRGLQSPLWVHRLFAKLLLDFPDNSWFAFYVCGFGEGWSGRSKDCTILKIPDSSKEYVLWEVEQ